MDQLDEGPPSTPVPLSVMNKRMTVVFALAVAWGVCGSIAYFWASDSWRWYVFHLSAVGYIISALIAERLMK